MKTVLRDFRYALRTLRKSRVFTLLSTATLALGIGANVAIFQLLDAVRLRTLPVREPGQLAAIQIVDNRFGRTGDFSGRNPQLTSAIWEDLRDRQQAFSNIAAWGTDQLDLGRGGEVHPAEALWVSGGFFDTLGLRPSLGRLIQPSDDVRGCGSAGVVLSASFWHREFGGDPGAIGRNITLEGHPFEIIGVTPPSFFGVEVGRPFDVALPLCAEPIFHSERPRTGDRQKWWLATIGRLKPGWTVRRASTQLAAVSRSIFESTLPSEYDAVDRTHYLGFKLGALPASTGFSSLRRRYETPLWLLLAISGLVLLIACASLANLIMARATGRQSELAVRLALGASYGQLVRQLISESVVLAMTGAACGVALSRVLSQSLASYLSTEAERWSLDLTLDWRLLAFAAGLAVVTCVVFGVAPALKAARTSPGEAMKADARGSTAGRRGMGVRRILVVMQVAVSLVLLVGALLFVRTLSNLAAVDAGFHRDHLLVANIDLSPLKIPVSRRLVFRQELLSRLQAIPGVISASNAQIVPVSGNGWNENVSIPGSNVKRRIANFNRVSPTYFQTMGTPLLAGRAFGPADTMTSPPVAIVTETFSRKFMGGANPVGRLVGVGQQGGKPDQILQIVGVVKDTKYGDLREEFTPIVFTADSQDPEPRSGLSVILRSGESLTGLVSSIKRVTSEVNPAIGLQFSVFETMIRDSLLRERLMATLSGFFGLLAAVLAMIGLYGVISYMVARRQKEIGVRMALGATGRDVLTMVLKEATTLVAVGLAIGIVLALIAATTARALLFGLRPTDPSTLAIAVASLSAVALAAGAVPAWRAARANPVDSLRTE